jgi:hypothetical protein
MGELEPGSFALDPPCDRSVRFRRSVVLREMRSERRHRRLTALSGVLLFACMFLPAIKGCHQPVMPYEVPPFVPPYLYGLVFALIAIRWTARGFALAMLALRVLGSLVVLGSVVLIVIAPPIGILELFVGGVLIVTVGLYGTSESRLVASGIVVGTVSVVWFACWSVTPDALPGVYLSLASSAGLLLGCFAWLRELLARSPIDMPVAVAAARRRG